MLPRGKGSNSETIHGTSNSETQASILTLSLADTSSSIRPVLAWGVSQKCHEGTSAPLLDALGQCTDEHQPTYATMRIGRCGLR